MAAATQTEKQARLKNGVADIEVATRVWRVEEGHVTQLRAEVTLPSGARKVGIFPVARPLAFEDVKDAEAAVARLLRAQEAVMMARDDASRWVSLNKDDGFRYAPVEAAQRTAPTAAAPLVTTAPPAEKVHLAAVTARDPHNGTSGPGQSSSSSSGASAGHGAVAQLVATTVVGGAMTNSSTPSTMGSMTIQWTPEALDLVKTDWVRERAPELRVRDLEDVLARLPFETSVLQGELERQCNERLGLGPGKVIGAIAFLELLGKVQVMRPSVRRTLIKRVRAPDGAEPSLSPITPVDRQRLGLAAVGPN